jgi:hypothetical protein
MTRKIICDMIEIKGSLTRHEIVQRVINIFISTEYQQRGKGVQFWYPVEQLPSKAQLLLESTQLFILRPGGLRKWNFDFKVNVTPELGLGKGTHGEIALDIRSKKHENPQKLGELLEAINEIFTRSENDIDQVLVKYPDLQTSFQTGAKVEVLLKVLKWMFIMEDIVYWNYYGRAFLYNFLVYVVNEENEDRFKETMEKAKNPDQLKSFMKKFGIIWIPCED